jgi:hypothetical protein
MYVKCTGTQFPTNKEKQHFVKMLTVLDEWEFAEFDHNMTS